jgi:hypothetical protein
MINLTGRTATVSGRTVLVAGRTVLVADTGVRGSGDYLDRPHRADPDAEQFWPDPPACTKPPVPVAPR